jgi:hypothetical protein
MVTVLIFLTGLGWADWLQRTLFRRLEAASRFLAGDLQSPAGIEYSQPVVWFFHKPFLDAFCHA